MTPAQLHKKALAAHKRFRERNPDYMAKRMRDLRKAWPDYYSPRSVAQRARRRVEREAASA
jgi:hypothetical protein